jgi:hypothetical protein
MARGKANEATRTLKAGKKERIQKLLKNLNVKVEVKDLSQPVVDFLADSFGD